VRRCTRRTPREVRACGTIAYGARGEAWRQAIEIRAISSAARRRRAALTAARSRRDEK